MAVHPFRNSESVRIPISNADVCNYRIFNLFGKTVISLAILGDSSPNWRPSQFEYGLGNYRTKLDFGSAKILDYCEIMEALRANPGPIAMMVWAHAIAMKVCA